MTGRPPRPASLPPPGLPGLRPEWSRLVDVTDRTGTTHTWHVLDTGPPEPVGTLVCVHGNPTWSYLWRGLLAAAPPGWRVVAPDQLGMGWSQGADALRGVAERIDDLGDLTAALGVTGPVVSVGHDWGGIISLGWAQAHRAQLRGVVLGNTAVALTEADHGPALIRLAHLPGLRDTVCRRTPVFVRGATALSRPPLTRAVRDAFAAPYASAARRGAVADFVADIPFAPTDPSAPAVASVAEGVRTLDRPALLFWGPRDPVFSERYLEDLRDRLPHADVQRYEGASHLVTEDAPQYAAMVRQWVADLDRRSTGGEPAPGAGAVPTPSSLLAALAARAGDQTTAVAEVDGTRLSWAELASRVERLATGLVTSGLRPGQRVALLLPPSTELTTVVYAVWRAGGSVVVADRGLGLRGMRRALRGAQPAYVVGAASGLLAARAMGLPAALVAAGSVGRAVARRLGVTHRLADLVAAGDAATAPPPLPTADQECAVLFTSGATGPAKGVVYRHHQAAAQLELVRTAFGLTGDDRMVAAFAPFALLGPALGVATVVPAIDVTAPGTLTAPLLAEAVAAVDATVVFAAPAALRRVVATAGSLTPTQQRDLAGVRLLMSAGAPVPAALLRSVGRVLPAAGLHTPYGMTEALPVTDVSLAEIEAAGPGDGVCVGRPLPGVEVRVSPLDADGAATAPLTADTGVTGEITVRALHVKERYDALWSVQRASARDPGWHRTGDVGHLDGEGRLWVEGRLAHVLTTPAGVLTPVGVEQRVEAVPGVEAAAVVGVGPAGTQAVVVVVQQPGARRTRLLADPALRDRVREAAGVDVAAVLVTRRLPVDVRHASKVDRTALARWAGRVLAGHGAGAA